MPFFSLVFWDGVFSESHMSRLHKTLLATRIRIVDMPLLIGSTTRSRCASQDRIAEGLLLGCVLGHHLSLAIPLCIKEA
jgi:hypothetical protein